MTFYITAALRLTCLVSFVLLLIRTWAGPISGLISARSTLNVAALGFLAFVALIFVGRVRSEFFEEVRLRRQGPIWILYTTLMVAAIIPYLPAFNAPFLFDDYVHLTSASATESLASIIRRIFWEHPRGGDGFFRPLGSLYFWFTFKWAGWSPAAWHICGLAIHAVNTLLVYRLLRHASGHTWAAFGGAVFFAWHGSHVEAVCWTAASFDLLAVFFSLLTLIFACDSATSPFKTTAIMLIAAWACLSKESAYCLPLLVACLALFYQGPQRRRVFLESLWVALACAITFGYRLWYLQGIGGYRTAAGYFMVLSWHALSATQALLLRLWALLFLPVNWSAEPEFWLRVALALLFAALIFVIFAAGRHKPAFRGHLYASLLFTLCSALPVFPLLLIGWDLAGARVLYLPSVGMSLFWCVILVNEIKRKPSHIAIVSFFFILLFQLAALLQ